MATLIVRRPCWATWPLIPACSYILFEFYLTTAFSIIFFFFWPLPYHKRTTGKAMAKLKKLARQMAFDVRNPEQAHQTYL